MTDIQIIETEIDPAIFEAQAEWEAGAHARALAECEANRLAAFQLEADPLFFKWQAGEGTNEAWQAKRVEIRERYPYPELS